MENSERGFMHPDLQMISDWEFRIRTGFFTRLFFCKPSEWINWYGDCIRNDGGNGMYCTEELAKAWPNKIVMGDIKVGPG